ncbi:hypothetical protein [Portibacter marinus]|uniref:hypothetical protein n=1 Tax=Portibacter marinus TaxID=2898660 RepID=UPI001F3503F5|nr:hypothetical protein [Portibacter marinus]
MPLIIALLALFFPRVIILILYFLTSFFSGVYDSILLPVLGFLFMPVTLIAYTYTVKAVGPGSTTGIIIIAIAVVIDLGLWRRGSRRR